LDINRRDLITGLLAYALHAAAETGHWVAPTSPGSEDIRIAHPVWPDEIKSEADKALRQIAWVAASMASEGDWGVVETDILKSWTTPQTPDEDLPELLEKFDTLEPVAAAVELLPGISNNRLLCAIVDVGAGTTDIGIFQSITPDSKSLRSSRLIPTGPTLSVFKAGNDIDSALLKLISNRYPKEFAKNENDLKIRIRGLKENLFSYGKLSVYGIEILLSDLSNTNEVNQMISEIREKFELAFKNAGAGIRTWLSSKEGAESRIALAMAGGGAEIDFLVSALTQAINVEGVAHSLDLIKSELRNTYDLNGASYSRMVVALGGVSEIYETVIHEHTKLLAIPSLGYAKQKIS
jgi:molecular chaperone HscA